jgi:hypothetical protein
LEEIRDGKQKQGNLVHDVGSWNRDAVSDRKQRIRSLGKLNRNTNEAQ